jgi:hypothetical protein
VGLGALAIPGIGPVMLAGATATTIATTLSGGAIGAAAGSLVGALVGLGIPEERARVYNERVSRGEYLVIVDGTDDEIRRAEAILNHRGIQEFGVYDRPDVAPVRTDVTAATLSVTPVPVATTTDRESSREIGTTVATTSTSRFTSTDTVGRKAHAVGYFSQRSDVEQAINDLGNAGYLLSLVSLIAPQFERRDYFTGVNLYGRFNEMKSGFSEEQAHSYNDRVARGAYVLVVSGTADEVNRAASILSHHGIQDLQTYSLTSSSTTESVRSDTSMMTRSDTPSVTPTGNVTPAPLSNAATTTERQNVNLGDPPDVNVVDRRDRTV